MRKVMVLAVLLVLGCMVAAAQAETILYQDDFTSGSTLLSGTSLDVTSGDYGATEGSTWTSNGWKVYTATGRAYISTTTTSNWDAWLPLSVQSGYVYTLTATLYGEFWGSTGRYIAMGFGYASAGIPSTSVGFETVAKGMLVLTDTGSSTYKVGTSIRTASSWTSSYITYTAAGLTETWTNCKIVLDTTGATWTATFYVNDVSYGTYNYNSNGPITAVGFGATPASSYAVVKSFKLTAEEVPEPSTLALLAAGLVGLTAYAWRKRK